MTDKQEEELACYALGPRARSGRTREFMFYGPACQKLLPTGPYRFEHVFCRTIQTLNAGR